MIPGGETVIIERQEVTGYDQWNNPVTETAQTLILNALVGWGSTTTAYGTDRVTTSSAMTVYLPAGTEVQNDDTFFLRGERWRRDGEAQTWQTPPGFSIEPGVVVGLTRAEG